MARADDEAAAIAVTVFLGGRPLLSPSLGLLRELLSDEDLTKDISTHKSHTLEGKQYMVLHQDTVALKIWLIPN